MQSNATPAWTGYRGLGSVDPLEIVNLDARYLDLDNCGAPHLRRPDLYVEFPKVYPYAVAWNLDGANPQFFLDERRPVGATADFILDRVNAIGLIGVNVRFIWPSGRFSANQRLPSNIYLSDGDDMLTFADGVLIPAGQWIGIEISIDTATAAGTFEIGFEGRVRYYLQPTPNGGK